MSDRQRDFLYMWSVFALSIWSKVVFQNNKDNYHKNGEVWAIKSIWFFLHEKYIRYS